MVGDNEVIKISGWLVIVDYRLFVIPEDYVGDYKSSARIEFFDSAVIFSVADKILPLGGGESFIFHRAAVVGRPVAGGVFLQIDPISLDVEERSVGYVHIKMEDEDVIGNRVRYKEFLKGREVVDVADWLSFYKD
ncbi:hypothetical protein [Pseudomonas syringae]|uniref:Uncharacterized protein n=1 Tax=Pseudomonas syringae pv. actinidiae TaxID=103796 RepID=A0A2V0QCD2_PSESF|nr:hypothetical protein [Pseudomonas syringae]AQL37950.1 hypothetical protein JN853_16830 [Pseudomonas syringae pv. actinidiae ICMP 9853]EPM87232.1 hypothetical protein A260_13689 [Pseudomonas syringae pv. actinidiae ICMP 19068]EPM96089.1 hypothetical protein A258_14296 [Pseudomonas syringae pv. actinidiae ICMP 19104]EPN10399.1 hypothetical protein A252_13729 [Pseudomonas syringae pv. actinidiae ICMP 9855]KCU97287.1 hypothetical protein A250_14816 [Pseudomonas syringae pv. actinidiae ICMP 9617